MILGAGGQNTANFLNKIIYSIGYAVITCGGGVLIVVGVKTFIAGWIPDSKNIKLILLGLLTVAIGGALILMGINGFKSLANNLGQDFTA